MSQYTTTFYENQSDGSYRAARTILPAVLELTRPRTLVDVGCGVGTWLAAGLELGVERAVGYEGDWVRSHMLKHPGVELRTHDLEQPIRSEERFDLAMSLEVAEHLTEARARSFVADLCGLSDQVFFGAAVPGQGGVNHLNEQWQDYWVELFAEHGYRAVDAVRPNFWSDGSLPIHYRQNPFLFLSDPAWERFVQADGAPADLTPWPVKLVHPDMHLDKMTISAAPPTVGEIVRSVAQLPGAVARSLRSRMS